MSVGKTYLSLLIKYIRVILHHMERLKHILKSIPKEWNDKNNKENEIPIYYYPLEYLKSEYPYEYENIIRNRSRCFC